MGLIWLPLLGPIQSSDLGLIWIQGLMSPSLRWISLLRGSFGLNCAHLTPGEAESDFSAHSLTLTWSPEGGQPLDLSTVSYQPSVQQSHLLRMPQYSS